MKKRKKKPTKVHTEACRFIQGQEPVPADRAETQEETYP